jgi:hypothetical protein
VLMDASAELISFGMNLLEIALNGVNVHEAFNFHQNIDFHACTKRRMKYFSIFE